MLNFHATIHARPNDALLGNRVELGGQSIATLRIAPEKLGQTTLECSFEDALAALARLERMYCEPDGSFVWVSSDRDEPWQVDGVVYDGGPRAAFVDVKGTCPADQFDRLLQALGWPQTRLMFQLVRAAVFLDETEFRRVATSS
jgi:hypothetical protein